jgi:cold shock CspA family protein
MQPLLQIRFRDVEPSPDIERVIREKAEDLSKFFDRITSCRVMVEAPHRSHRKGIHYHVRIELSVPGKELVVGRHPGHSDAHEDVYVAVRDAFRAARRELQNYASRLRGEVKTHEEPVHGRVIKLLRHEGFGFIESPEGRELYFHRNSVLTGFDELEVGDAVRFAEELGEQGPQAASVTRVGRS